MSKDKKSKNPVKDKKDSWRVIRGGFWFNEPDTLRFAQRRNHDPSDRYSSGGGFRIVKNIPKKEKRDE